ncbi:MAG TPA: AI-2E family transporter, partial [Longimicrobiales bacterium]|nr:AI-2E family transporter [Longimicrobiales bacterium]
MAWLDRAPQSLSDVQDRLQVVTRGMERIAQATEKVDEIASPGGRDADQVAVANGPELSDRVFSGTRSLLVGGTVTVVLIYFLLASGDLFLRKLVRVLPRFRNKRNAVRITRDAQETVSYYLLTMSLINVGLAVVQALAMWALGVPNPLLWGVMAGVLNYIPYIGPIVGTGVVSLVALIAFDELSRAMLVPGIYLLVSVLEGNLVTPILLGRSLTMNPVVIFVWVLFW